MNPGRRYHITITERTRGGETETVLDQDFDLVEAEYTVEPVDVPWDENGDYPLDGLVRFAQGDYSVKVYARGIRHPSPPATKRKK